MNLAAPLFLLGLAALALPWLLHRFGQQQPEERAFASDRFLEAVPPPASRRSTLRYRMLFALRVLALIGLCLLFARPWLPSLAARAPASTLHLAVLDASLSMRAEDRFDTAVDALRDRLQSLPADDPVQLYTFDTALQRISGEDAFAADALSLLGTLRPGFGRGDMGELMRSLDAVAARADLPVAAIVATDAQRSALPRRLNDLFAPSLASLELIGSAASSPLANVRVEARAASDDTAQARVDVRLSSSGTEDTVAGSLRIERGGEVLATRSVQLAPGADTELVFDALTLPPGQTDELSVRFAADTADALIDDDRQSVALRRPAPVRVALAGFGGAVPEAARVFLATALSIGPGDEAAGASTDVDLDIIAGGSQRLPDDVDLAIVLAGMTDPAADQAIRSELERGVDVLWLPLADRRTLQDGSSSVSSSAEGETVSRIDQSHPLALGDIDWFGVRRYADAKLELQPGDSALVATGNGVPLLIERPSSFSGRLLLLDDPLDGEASNLPFEPAFVELLAAVREWFDEAGAIPARLEAGAPLRLPDGMQIFDPDGKPMRAFDERAEGSREFVSVPGLYRVRDERGEHLLEVVTDPRESVLVPMTPDEQQGWVDRHAVEQRTGESGVSDEQGAEPASAAEPAARPEQRWLFLWLLPAVALLLMAESVVANRRLDVRRDGS